MAGITLRVGADSLFRQLMIHGKKMTTRYRCGMKVGYQKELQVLLFIVLTGAVALVSLPRIDWAWTGLKTVRVERDFGLSVLREAMLMAMDSGAGDNAISLDGRVWKTSGSAKAWHQDADIK
jgi:hypothetical protein